MSMPERANSNQFAVQTIRAWVGEKVFKRGQDYQLRGRVRDLAATPAGGLVAWVQGSERYATRVVLNNDQLAAGCTCPYSGICKHVVAVALTYINRPDQAPPLPVAALDDPRIVLLDRMAAAAAATAPPAPAGDPALHTAAAPAPAGDPALHTFLAALSHQELVALMLELAQRLPDLREALAVRQMLATDDADQLEAEVFGRIIEATAEIGWHDRWDDDSHQPDYGPVYDGLRLLLERGHADAVVRLGEELLEAGISQIEQSHADGGTASEVASCLGLVFAALPQSSLAPDEQLRWVFDALLRDPYDLCLGAQDVLALPYAPQAWSSVADELIGRLGTVVPRGDSHTQEYRRHQLADFALMALEGAGRDAEIIALCEREARENGNYQRLVERLLAAGRSTEAEQWARTGISAIARQYPGSADQLREMISKLRAQAGDWAMVAALRADAFFERPSLQALRVLDAAATQAQVAPAVRANAVHYLETGQLPRSEAQIRGAVTIPPWPLPDSGIPRAERRHPLQFPQLGLLMELAISEDQPAQVLRWYDQRGAGRQFYLNDDMVADAVAKAYPERAAAIWQHLAEAHIAQTTPASYQQAALFLRKLRQVRVRQGQLAAWRTYIEGLRTANRRKRRLVETLDELLREA